MSDYGSEGWGFESSRARHLIFSQFNTCNNSMRNWFASAAVLTSFSQVLCLFCCIVPTATGILAIFTTLGLTSSNLSILRDLSIALHPYKNQILMVSLSLISTSWGLWFYSKTKIGCGCSRRDQRAKKPIFLIIASALLAFNLMAMILWH